jgi:hypothetical protein
VTCAVGRRDAHVHRQAFGLSDGGSDGTLRGGQPNRRGHDDVGIVGSAFCRLVGASVRGLQTTRR